MLGRARGIAIRAAGAAVVGVGLTYGLKRGLEAEAPFRSRKTLGGDAAVDPEHLRTVTLPPVQTEGGEARRRVVSFREYGDPAGLPVLFLHAPGSSRLELTSACAEPWDVRLPSGLSKDRELVAGGAEGGELPPSSSAAARLGLRVIAIDRPGYGSSTDSSPPPASGGLGDTAAWVLAVADALGLGKFALVASGAAGGYALASAAELSKSRPGRISCVAVVGVEGPWQGLAASRGAVPAGARAEAARLRREASGAVSVEGPAGRMLGRVSSSVPMVAEAMVLWLRRSAVAEPAGAARDAARMLKRAGEPGEAAAMLGAAGGDGRRQAVLGLAGVEALRPGAGGVVADAAALSGGAWAIDTDAVAGAMRAPGGAGGAFVQLWHGEDDRCSPVQWAQALAADLPAGSAQLRVLPGVGHWTLLSKAWPDVLAGVAERMLASATEEESR
ncbi:hypothetical protein FNF27_06338 [Cafeteria roenbergensis]|uniref:AB hydrolase-1 domain-containing protein n=1 Tax=Cafeteria roenbergensis TaxID=33653 RepID=A0A5A8C4T7_CAFRO|nr:hypothetical protein FNF29_07772 [Cafeteria roenbergensis]KAA0171428.1 hypothetical protein FNF27_06338 [Cafeteria roenbergensis]|eukprot:KAA0146891.1 hypothetical protein FNF29_07772 [Cafeteria roenbergensis]